MEDNTLECAVHENCKVRRHKGFEVHDTGQRGSVKDVFMDARIVLETEFITGQVFRTTIEKGLNPFLGFTDDQIESVQKKLYERSQSNPDNQERVEENKRCWESGEL